MATEQKSEERKMNIFAKLSAVRSEFYEAGARKSGKNLHAEFMYFELQDIVPIAEKLFKKYNLFMIQTFVDGHAEARIIDIDDPARGAISFTIPLVFISEPAKFRMNEVQGVGAAVTYYRRYLYMIVLDLVEADEIDNQNGDKNLAETPVSLPEPAPKKPVSSEERKAIKAELTSTDRPITDEEQQTMRKWFKTLLNQLPEQEEFVTNFAIKTNNFSEVRLSQYTSIIETVKEMIAECEEVK